MLHAKYIENAVDLTVDCDCISRMVCLRPKAEKNVEKNGDKPQQTLTTIRQTKVYWLVVGGDASQPPLNCIANTRYTFAVALTLE